MIAVAPHTPARRTTSTGGRLARGLAAVTAAVAASLSLTQPALAPTPAPPAVPSKIAVPAGNTLSLVGHAIGVQIYSCNATGGSFAWTLVAPRANLYDNLGRRIITHYAGPTWEAKAQAASSASASMA